MFGVRDMFKFIKSNKQMSMDHWRYRLLHWTWGLNKDGCKEWVDSDGEKCTSGGRELPRFFYTHYCPLFHMTNILAIFSPIILFLKLWCLLLQFIFFTLSYFVNLLRNTYKYIRNIFGYIGLWANKFKRKEAKKSKKIGKVKVKNKPKFSNPKKILADAIINFQKSFSDLNCNFDTIWRIEGWSKSTFGKSKSELEEIYNRVRAIIDERRRKDELRREKIKKRVLFWVNISQSVIKGFFNLLYVSLFVGVGFLTFVYGGSFVLGSIACTYYIIATLVSVHWWNGLLLIGYWGGLVASGVVILALIITFLYFSANAFCKVVVKTNFTPILLPYSIVRDILVAVGGYIANICISIIDFISMFYAENCPGITIIDSENE
jgi:hypothetical protein